MRLWPLLLGLMWKPSCDLCDFTVAMQREALTCLYLRVRCGVFVFNSGCLHRTSMDQYPVYIYTYLQLGYVHSGKSSICEYCMSLNSNAKFPREDMTIYLSVSTAGGGEMSVCMSGRDPLQILDVQ